MFLYHNWKLFGCGSFNSLSLPLNMDPCSSVLMWFHLYFCIFKIYFRIYFRYFWNRHHVRNFCHCEFCKTFYYQCKPTNWICQFHTTHTHAKIYKYHWLEGILNIIWVNQHVILERETEHLLCWYVWCFASSLLVNLPVKNNTEYYY